MGPVNRAHLVADDRPLADVTHIDGIIQRRQGRRGLVVPLWFGVFYQLAVHFKEGARRMRAQTPQAKERIW